MTFKKEQQFTFVFCYPTMKISNHKLPTFCTSGKKKATDVLQFLWSILFFYYYFYLLLLLPARIFFLGILAPLHVLFVVNIS